jgi:hypothetical protein
MAETPLLTERQQQWFASVRASLQTSTGRSLEAWAELARQCPETAHRKRLAWMKQQHGLGQNYASLVLNAAFPPSMSWSEPAPLEDTLWADAGARAIFERVRAMATALPDVLTGQRKTFTAFSRNFQFAAARPVKSTVRLGLAIEAGSRPGFSQAGKESWSERLHAVIVIDRPEAVLPGLAEALRAAWERS